MNPKYFISEVSWEVANKVGGIYTVLSSRAGEMMLRHGEREIIFNGPLLRPIDKMTDFRPATFSEVLPKSLSLLGVTLPLTQGYWLTPGGEAQTILVDYKPFVASRDKLYYLMWEHYGIQSELGYGDYDDSCLFAVAAAETLRIVTPILAPSDAIPIAIYNEWTTGMGLLYHHIQEPSAHTLFITHATTVGRSICSNGKDLYRYFDGYHGDQMARELHVQAKHCLEKKAAHVATTFATVSAVTALECTQLLERTPIVLPNGFGSLSTTNKYNTARKQLFAVAETLYGHSFDQASTRIIGTSGRYEYRNKGIDLLVQALEILRETPQSLSSDIIVYFFVPAWVSEPRADLAYLLTLGAETHIGQPLEYPYLTHWLHNMQEDLLSNGLAQLLQWDITAKRIYPIFVPTYLDGYDGVFDMPYYDLLKGLDLTLFPSYYEPWGYTPLESIAYGVPTVTTDLSGFGQTILDLYGNEATTSLRYGVQVLPRRQEGDERVVAHSLAEVIRQASQDLPITIRRQARESATQALWSEYYNHYMEAYREMTTD